MKNFGMFLIAVIVAVSIANRAYQQSKQNAKLTDIFLANVEALATDETIEGKVCRYPGSSVYDIFIPCTAEYPNIGPCSENVWGYYSSDKAQCYK